MRRGDCKAEIGAAAREHAAAALGLALLETTADLDLRLTQAGLSRQDLQTAAGRLEETYAVRAFALFEAALRGFWTATVRPTEPVVSVLIDRIATRCGIPDPVRVDAHGVREFRNAVIHEGGRGSPGRAGGSCGTTQSLRQPDAERMVTFAGPLSSARIISTDGYRARPHAPHASD